MGLTWLDAAAPADAFPNPDRALREPNGLLAAGGDLSPARLLAAYRLGIFPWYEAGQPVLWWSPAPRAVLLPDELHLPRRLKQQLRKLDCHITTDQAFDRVIAACAGPRSYSNGTWITDDMQLAYQRLHALGYAHSVEVWREDCLVGGLYGLQLGQAFFGESMFSHESNTSKAALIFIVQRLAAQGLELVDCQMMSTHLELLGARSISRQDFKQRLANATSHPNAARPWDYRCDNLAKLCAAKPTPTTAKTAVPS